MAPKKEKVKLTDERNSFKPFNYPWAYEAWLKHEQSHWLHTEVSCIINKGRGVLCHTFIKFKKLVQADIMLDAVTQKTLLLMILVKRTLLPVSTSSLEAG